MLSHSFNSKHLAIVALIFAILFMVTDSQARKVSFSWKANSEDVDGYKLHYKTGDKGGPPYDHTVTINGKNTTSFTLQNLADNQTYFFRLTAFKTDGNLESPYSKELILEAKPTATFTTTLVTGSSLKVAVDASSSTGSSCSFKWNFGDGTTATGKTATHLYSESGNYTITLTAENDFGESTTTKTVELGKTLSNITPNAIIFPSKITGPTPLLAKFNGSSSSDLDNDPLHYSWDFGDGTATASGEKVAHLFQTPGSYTITLNVQDGQGGSSSATSQVIVTESTEGNSSFQSPIAKILAKKLGSINKRNKTFIATFDGSKSQTSAPGITIVKYAWNFGDGTTGSGAKVQHTYSSLHHYTITLTLTDSLGKHGVERLQFSEDTLLESRPVGYLNAVFKLLLID